MSNQDEPITNNPLLPFLRSLQTNSAISNKALTPVETLTPSRRARDVKVAKTNEKEEAAKPGSSQIFPNYKILYMKDDEILLFGLQVISNPGWSGFGFWRKQLQVSSSAPAILLVLGLLLTTAGGLKVSLTVENHTEPLCRQPSHCPGPGSQVCNRWLTWLSRNLSLVVKSWPGQRDQTNNANEQLSLLLNRVFFKREDPETWTKSLVYGPILVVVGLGMIGVGVAICVFARTSRELPFSSLTKWVYSYVNQSSRDNSQKI